MSNIEGCVDHCDSSLTPILKNKKLHKLLFLVFLII